MFFSVLTTISLLFASVTASPTLMLENRELDSRIIAGRAAGPTIYMRIEGPTKTIYEETIVATYKQELTIGGHTAPCSGVSKKPGVTSYTALDETKQFFNTEWTGTTFGDITEINKTKNNGDLKWLVAINLEADGGSGGFPVQSGNDYCEEVIQNDQHLLYAYIDTSKGVEYPLIMSGPKTAKVGQTVQYTAPFAPDGTYVNDLSEDTTTGERVKAVFSGNKGASASVSIKFTKKGTYNMKAHCLPNTSCLRSNHVVTVVS